MSGQAQPHRIARLRVRPWLCADALREAANMLEAEPASAPSPDDRANDVVTRFQIVLTDPPDRLRDNEEVKRAYLGG